MREPTAARNLLQEEFFRYSDTRKHTTSMIVGLTPEQAENYIQQLAELLMDAVDSGASVGFMPPLAEAEALDYWRNVIGALREKRRVLLAALEGDVMQGSVHWISKRAPTVRIARKP